MNVLSLFDGISAGRVALERAGIKINKYYASEIDKYAIRVTMNNYPDTIQMGDVYNIDYSKLENIDMVIGGSPCFTKGNKVLTESGYKNIEDIEVGEFVFTHKKNYKKVTFIGNEKKEIVEIKAQGFLTTETTKEHPFYVREMKRVWDKNKRCYERVFSDPKWKKAIDLTKNDFIGIPILESSENKHNLSNEDCWLLGRYVADGHIRKTKRKDRVNSFQYQVVYSIGDKKVEYFKEKIKNKHFSCYKHTKSTHRIVFSNMDLLEFIKNNNFGEGALNKNIPKFILDLPVNLLKEFLEGYFSGDGYEKDGVVYATTISKDLAIGICLAVAKVFKVSCGISFNKKPSKHIIEGREVNQKNNYTITFRRERKKQSNFYSDGEFVWNPVKNITVKNEDTVYNITVDEDESYTINNAVVHNCTHWSIAKKDRETTSEGIGFDLFMQFVKAIEKVKPKYFLYENNFSIHKDIKQAISEKLGVQPIMINSALLSAQQRKREYWTNIPNITQPQNKGIFLKDILESGITEKNKSFCIDASYYKGGNLKMHIEKSKRTQIFEPVRMGQIGKGGQGDRIYSVQGKSVCLSANGGDRGAKTGLYKIDLPDGDYFIRKLTPVECERLQTFPENYTDGISNTQRYKCIGNSWTVDIIAHILKGVKNEKI